MKIILITCAITIFLSMAWGKHLLIKTKDTANKDPMIYDKDDATDTEYGTAEDYWDRLKVWYPL